MKKGKAKVRYSIVHTSASGKVVEKRVRVFLDELPKNVGRYAAEPDVECGVACFAERKESA